MRTLSRLIFGHWMDTTEFFLKALGVPYKRNKYAWIIVGADETSNVTVR